MPDLRREPTQADLEYALRPLRQINSQRNAAYQARRRSIDYRREVRARPVIVSDGDRVLQIVGNLLSNAFKATPDGGRIQLELGQRNGTVLVAVEDIGPGIPDERRVRLFRPFVSERSGGTAGVAA